jgi:hypothetical protein
MTQDPAKPANPVAPAAKPLPDIWDDGTEDRHALSPAVERIDFEARLAQAYAKLRAATDRHAAAWGMGEEKIWQLDPHLGRLIFHFEGDRQVAVPMQFLGKYNPVTGIFFWAWSTTDASFMWLQDALRLKTFGIRHGLPELTLTGVQADEDRIWHYAALAMELSGASCVYRVPQADGYVLYMTIGEPV